MSNIVFVQPPLTREERYGVKSQGGGETPPIGLAILAAMARKNGFETAIIDAERQRMSDEEVTKEIISKNFRHVGITSVTIAIDNAARLAQAVKVADPGITVIVGGPHLTAVPEETMKRYTVFDIGVIGEGDYTIIKLLKCLEGNGNLGDVKGIIFRRNGTTHCTPPRTGVENMDELPKPAWDLLPDLATHYCPPVHTLKRVPAALLVASRGCPMKCNFCARSVFGNNCRAYSAEYTFEMIKGLM
ncbi:MAG: B12-binding domain-containing radical SAM protein, partial [Candidatus Brocadiales bacterium]